MEGCGGGLEGWRAVREGWKVGGLRGRAGRVEGCGGGLEGCGAGLSRSHLPVFYPRQELLHCPEYPASDLVTSAGRDRLKRRMLERYPVIVRGAAGQDRQNWTDQTLERLAGEALVKV